MKPLFDKVIIDVQKVEVVTSSGIYLAGAEDKRLEKATVKAIGPDVQHVKEGDEIVFKGYSADTIALDGKEEVSFIKEEDILAIM